MVFVRGHWFRAVDSNDQLRLGKVHFVVITKKKVWVKLSFGLVEICLVNIYIIVVNTEPEFKDLTQEEFRWQLVEELVQKANELDAAAARRADATATSTAPAARSHRTPLQIRLEGRNGSHHHEIQSEYISLRQAVANQKVVDDDPAANPSKR